MRLSLGLGLPTNQNIRPGWALPLSVLDFDFAAGHYFGGSPSNSLSLTRASSALAQDADGTWRSFGSGVLRITDQGLLIEEARTNKCTNYNANPTDLTSVTKSGDAASTLTVVDDTAALAAAGLQNIATSGKVYKLDNSAGGTTAFASVGGTTGNTNIHSISTYARITSGTGQLRLTNNVGLGQAVFSGSAYALYKNQNLTPAVTSSVLIIQAEAGAVVFFILNQLEEGAFVTSPIVVAGSSAARAADVISLTGQAATKALAAKAAFFQTNGSAAQAGARIIEFGTSLAYVNVQNTTTGQIGYNSQSVNGVAGSGTYSGTVKHAAGMDSTSMTLVLNGGTKGTTANPWVATGTAYLGNRAAGDRAINAYIERFALSLTKGGFDARTV